jgi:hypothetical protein
VRSRCDRNIRKSGIHFSAPYNNLEQTRLKDRQLSKVITYCVRPIMQAPRRIASHQSRSQTGRITGEMSSSIRNGPNLRHPVHFTFRSGTIDTHTVPSKPLVHCPMVRNERRQQNLYPSKCRWSVTEVSDHSFLLSVHLCPAPLAPTTRASRTRQKHPLQHFSRGRLIAGVVEMRFVFVQSFSCWPQVSCCRPYD